MKTWIGPLLISVLNVLNLPFILQEKHDCGVKYYMHNI